jgi:hypothetical protein
VAFAVAAACALVAAIATTRWLPAAHRAREADAVAPVLMPAPALEAQPA